MSPTALTFLGYLAWMILILVTLGMYRTSLVLGGKRRANDFSPTGDDVSPFSNRMCRAHANCYEAFPFFGGLLLFALATDQTAITDGLAYILLAARVVQSLVHIASTSVLAVLLRFTAFLVQVGICVYWLYQFLMIQLG